MSSTADVPTAPGKKRKREQKQATPPAPPELPLDEDCTASDSDGDSAVSSVAADGFDPATAAFRYRHAELQHKHTEVAQLVKDQAIRLADMSNINKQMAARVRESSTLDRKLSGDFEKRPRGRPRTSRDLEYKIKDLRKELAEAKATIKKMETADLDYKESTKKAIDECAKLKTRNQELVNDHEGLRRVLHRTVEDFNKSDVATLQKNYDSCTRVYEETYQQKQILDNENQKLKRQVAALIKDLDALRPPMDFAKEFGPIPFA